MLLIAKNALMVIKPRRLVVNMIKTTTKAMVGNVNEQIINPSYSRFNIKPMNNRFSCLTFLLVLIFLNCCKKDVNNPSNSLLSIPKIHQVITYNDSLFTSVVGIQTFEYDSRGRCTSLTTDFNRLSDTLTINYSGSIVILTEGTYKSTYTLDLNGLATMQIMPNNDTVFYKYDESGYEVEEKSRGDIFTFGYLDGNKIHESHNSSTINYSFNNDKVNTIGQENYGIAYLGKQNKNLIRSYVDPSGITVTYSYEFDSKNRVIKERNGGYKTYNYNE
jgi:hypothetical protein